MKKFILILGLCLAFSVNVRAELYHGIDIDEIYNSSDWDSKESIKEIIDDYTLLLQYQAELDSCPIELPDVLECYDKVAEKIVTNLYVHPETNLEKYKQFKIALADAFGTKNCRNKYAWPSGHMCELDILSDMSDILKKYITDLLSFSSEQMSTYSPILKEYK